LYIHLNKGDISMKFFNTLKHFVTLSALLGTSAARAAPPHLPNLLDGGNEWTITYYNDTSPTHTQQATQTLCFYPAGVVGTHQQYYWVSTTYRDWNGYASQEGDQVFMYGDFQWPFGVKDVGHDGMQWEIVTNSPKNMGAGHWNEWLEDGRMGNPIAFGNAVFQRIGKCKFETVGEAFEYGQTLGLTLDANNQALSPMGMSYKSK
jgi:hypothetical protein